MAHPQHQHKLINTSGESPAHQLRLSNTIYSKSAHQHHLIDSSSLALDHLQKPSFTDGENLIYLLTSHI